MSAVCWTCGSHAVRPRRSCSRRSPRNSIGLRMRFARSITGSSVLARAAEAARDFIPFFSRAQLKSAASGCFAGDARCGARLEFGRRIGASTRDWVGNCWFTALRAVGIWNSATGLATRARSSAVVGPVGNSPLRGRLRCTHCRPLVPSLRRRATFSSARILRGVSGSRRASGPVSGTQAPPSFHAASRGSGAYPRCPAPVLRSTLPDFVWQAPSASSYFIER